MPVNFCEVCIKCTTYVDVAVHLVVGLYWTIEGIIGFIKDEFIVGFMKTPIGTLSVCAGALLFAGIVKNVQKYVAAFLVMDTFVIFLIMFLSLFWGILFFSLFVVFAILYCFVVVYCGTMTRGQQSEGEQQSRVPEWLRNIYNVLL